MSSNENPSMMNKQVQAASRPQGLLRVDGLFFDGNDLVVAFAFFLGDVHAYRVGDEVGVGLDDMLQAEALKEFLRIILDMQHNICTAAIFVSRGKAIFTLTV